jgi:thiamine pyrophosphate-dependent acetolactate synthase large subunit-like protein
MSTGAPAQARRDRHPELGLAVRYAEICGAHGVRVTDAGQLDDALAEAIAAEGPALVEVITEPELI